ncbi:phosphotransferase [Streptomyces sp. NPDC126499]|uniref:phosphotransferase n=1 Tax=Streptomyces sp. NPDC126499 TaxID=3155314 RepID=UPI00332F1412
MREVAVAAWAATLRGPDGGVVSPPVVGVRSGRPRLERVPGPRLDTRIRTGRYSPVLLESAGRTLATLHSATSAVDVTGSAAFEEPLWEPVSLETHLGLSAAQSRILSALHGDRVLRDRGRLVRERLREEITLCHGDARTANFCVTESSDSVLIDWESAGRGHPAGDMAGLLGAILSDLLVHSGSPVRTDPSVVLATAVDRWTVAVRAALSGYRRANGDDLGGIVGPAVGSALLVRAFTRAAYTTYDRTVACLYEVGSSLLRAPERWKAIDAQG